MSNERKIDRMIDKWSDLKKQATDAKIEADFAGQSKKDSGAMKAYIKIFDLFITDLAKLK